MGWGDPTPGKMLAREGRRAADSVGYKCRLLGRTRTLDSHASRLRRKLNRPGEATYVVNVWGVGYRLVASAP